MNENDSTCDWEVVEVSDEFENNNEIDNFEFAMCGIICIGGVND